MQILLFGSVGLCGPKFEYRHGGTVLNGARAYQAEGAKVERRQKIGMGVSCRAIWHGVTVPHVKSWARKWWRLGFVSTCSFSWRL